VGDGQGAVADLGLSDGAIDPEFWSGRRVLLTGHSGFKGAWMALWLQSLGASLTGFGGAPPTEPSLYALARVDEGMQEIEGDVRDARAVERALAQSRPEVVIHMAAQSLVRRSFAEPRETYETNVMGTVNVLDAVRNMPGVRVVVSVTSDKCYENPVGPEHAGGRGTARAFREEDRLGGDDPYSSSKGAAELVTSAYRRSFFADADAPRVASARAGNVIGGGDWARDRLLPDLMRAAIGGEAARLRNPQSVRPWQHVLNPLSGYLLLAHALWDSPAAARAWNFGPLEEDARPVAWIARRVAELWPGGIACEHDEGPHPAEAPQLRLDSTRAHDELGWRPPLALERGLEATVQWYRALSEGADMRALTLEQIEGASAA
jgi:CDP-glucose 4,6-dehydratase